jgi:hypothetical protein
VAPRHGLATRVRRRAVVAYVIDLVASGLTVELNPVDRRSATHEQQLLFVEAEEDAIADHESIVAAGHHLLGPVRRKVGEAIDGEARHELRRIGSSHRDLGHVMRLIEQHRRMAPCALLVPPVGELARYDRVHIGADPRMAQ